MKRSPLKRTSRLNPVSKKRRIQNATYSKLRKEHLAKHKKCEVCNTKEPNQIHHRRGRWGERLNDAAFFLAVCEDCHNKIHQHPDWAYANGYMISR